MSNTESTLNPPALDPADVTARVGSSYPAPLAS